MTDGEPTTMPDYELFVFIYGDSQPSRGMFSVTAPANISVSALKGRVFNKKQNRLKGIDAATLTLWKVLPLCSFRRTMC